MKCIQIIAPNIIANMCLYLFTDCLWHHLCSLILLSRRCRRGVSLQACYRAETLTYEYYILIVIFLSSAHTLAIILIYRNEWREINESLSLVRLCLFTSCTYRIIFFTSNISTYLFYIYVWLCDLIHELLRLQNSFHFAACAPDHMFFTYCMIWLLYINSNSIRSSL